MNSRYRVALGVAVSLLISSFTPTGVIAGEADVINATITPAGEGRYRIDATVSHADTGWDHYANRWEVLAEDGSVIGVRELAHPHVNEQPFTRSLTISLPPETRVILIRAFDSVHDSGGKLFELMLPVSENAR